MEQEWLLKRIMDLAEKSYRNNLYTYTHFLNPEELSCFLAKKEDFASFAYQVFGGNENCERKMIGFGNPQELGYEGEFPIQLIKISPLLLKFAKDFSHRDVLGAIMHLGIERDVIGDIMVKDKFAYVYCESSITEFIIEHLEKVRNTNVKCEVADLSLPELSPTLKEEKVIVASLRLDALICAVFKLSRKEVLEYFRSKKVFMDYAVVENNSVKVKEGSIISVRGFGKICFKHICGETKKGKIMVVYDRYV
ncbi:MAG: DbpA RNA binding domain-containing protein [Lachnospiraceae bacterium]|nr:DbpA RNA binding domain-containing protein [Lachnospiraceae bacterium]